MDLIKLSIANNYSKTPGPRNKKEGDFSGEDFRENLLLPTFRTAISERKKLEINLDGTAGYGTSFLEEAFGGIVRSGFFDSETLLDNIIIISTEEEYLINDIKDYIKDAEKDRKK